jgi:hypothetical protein
MKKVVVSLVTALALVGVLSWLLIWRTGGREAVLDTAPAVSPAAKSPARAHRTPKPAAPGKKAEAPAPAVLAEGEKPLLSGKVVDAAERGIASARITVLFPEATPAGGPGSDAGFRARLLGRGVEREKPLGEAVSGADGSYAVAFAVPPKEGEYRVVARAPGYSQREESWLFEGTPTTLDLRLDDGGDTIEGWVAGAGGAAVPGARVEAARDDDDRGFGGFFGDRGRAVDHDLADQEGRFKLVVSPGRYRLSAQAEGYAPGTARGVESGSREVRIDLRPGRALSGRVIDQNGSGVEGAEVALFPQEDARRGPPSRVRRLFQEPVARAETAEDGQFRIPDLSVQGYVLDVKKSGYERGERSGTLAAAGEEKPVEVQLKPGGILTGTVTDEEGGPVVGALIVLRNDKAPDGGAFNRGPGGPGGRGQAGRGGRGQNGTGQGGPGQAGRNAPAPKAAGSAPEPVPIFRADALTESDPTGKFRFDTIARSTYTVSVQSDRHVSLVQAPVEVAEPVDLALKLDSGFKLTGQVLESAGGQPVPRASLRVTVGDSDRRTVQADAEGRYSFQGLSPGVLREIQVRAKGFTISYADQLEIQAAPREQTHDFALDRSASVAGRVVSAAGEPVAGARVRVVSVEGETPPDDPGGNGQNGPGRWNQMRRRSETERTDRTNGEGAFLIKEVNAGPAFRVVVSHPDYHELRSDPFEIQAGAQIENLVYKLKAGGKVRITVARPDATPAANLRVELNRQREEPAQDNQDPRNRRQNFQQARNDRSSRSTSPEGVTTFAGLDAASYTVQLVAAGFQPWRRRDVAVGEDQTAEIAIQLLPENTIPGFVLDSTGAPVAGARLRASPVGDGQAAGDAVLAFAGGGGRFNFQGGDSSRASSQADGSFKLGTLAEGPYRIQVSADGFADQTVDSAEVNRSLEVRMVAQGAIEGVVMVGETGEPVTRFTVLLQRDRGRGRSGGSGDDGGAAPGGGFGGGGPGGAFGGGPGGGPGGGFGGGRGGGGRRGRSTDFEDAGGAFRLPDIDPGSYLVRVTAEDLSPREVTVRVNEGKASAIRVVLYEGIVITGTVTDQSTNQPLEGAEVMVLSAPEDENPAPAAAPTGRLARLNSSGPSRTPDLSGGPAPQVGRPVTQTVLSDTAGAFAIREVPAGKYVLVVNHPDFVIGQQPFEIKAEGLTRDLRIAVSPGEELSGTITLADGTAGASVMVSMRDAQGLEKRSMADGIGRYLVRGLKPGPYTLSVQSQGSPYREQLQIKKGENLKNVGVAAQ